MMLSFHSRFSCFILTMFFLFVSSAKALTVEESVPGFCGYNGAIQNIYGGSANGSYVNISNEAGKGVNWAVQVPQAGSYTLSFRYSNAGSQSATQAALRVNGVAVAQGLSFPKTSTWMSWISTVPFTVSLSAGNNTIRLETITATEFAMIDSLTINGASVTSGVCSSTGFTPKPANNGTIQESQAPVLASAPAQSTTIDLASAIPAKFDINNSGQAIYNIPITTAAGRGGMTPNIAVSYNSGGGNGLMGLGWSLDVGGGITRCRQTEAQDKNAAPITWGADDRFCLNGARLLVDTGYSYGAPNSRYKTEVDSFVRVTAVGGVIGQPEYFKVERKDGHIEFYGVGYAKFKLDSSKVLSWMLSSKEDSAGNKIEYSYLTDQYGEYPLIENIYYAFNNSGTPSANVYFEWENRDDFNSGYVGGLKTYYFQRLSKIQTNNNNEELHTYTFKYNQGANYTSSDKLSRLSSVTDCVGSICKPSTQFLWELPIVDGLISNSGIIDINQSYESLFVHAFADINGDGLSDLAWKNRGDLYVNYAFAAINSVGKIVYTKQAFENGAQVQQNYYVNSSEAPVIRFTDYNSDSRADLVIEDSPAGELRVYLSKPKADGTWVLASSPVQTFSIFGGNRIVIADFNGDGLEDIVDLGAKRIRYLQPSGVGYSAYQNVIFHSPPISNSCSNSPIQRIRNETGDFNGDGRVDFIVYSCVSNGSSNVFEQHIYTSHLSSSGVLEFRYHTKVSNVQSTSFGYDCNDNADHKIRVVDLNSDGLSDIVGGDFSCELGNYRLNTGNGFSAPISLPAFTEGANNFADYNQDGYPDFISLELHGGDPNILKVYLWDPRTSTFSNSGSVINTQYEIDYLDTVSFQDLNGDGATDFFVATRSNYSNAPSKIRVQLNKAYLKSSNKIRKITNGLGHTTKVKYEHLSNTRHYGFIKGVNASVLTENICESSDFSSVCWTREKMSSNADELNWYSTFNISGSQQKLENVPSYPLLNVVGSMTIVVETAESSPSASDEYPQAVASNDEQYRYYYYEQARMQAAGRGFLGFRKFTEIDYQTGIRTVKEFRQDWPFVGRQIKNEVYVGNKLINFTETHWGLAGCYSGVSETSNCATDLGAIARSQGSSALGALNVFSPTIKSTNYYLNTNGIGSFSNLVETRKAVDQKGNPTFVRVATGSGGAPLHTEETTNNFSYPTYSYSSSMGRLSSKIVVATQYGDLGSDSIRRESSFDYYTSGAAIGLLAYEIIEPNNSDYTIRTDHYYNAVGLRTFSATTSNGQTRRSTELEYDAGGRYVDKTYEYYTSGINNGAVRYLATSVNSRDKYGIPTEEQKFLGGTGVVTYRAATTQFGNVYFTASSLGDFTLVDAGTGTGADGLCSNLTKVWQKVIQAGGGATVKCIDVAGRVIREATQGFEANQWSITDFEYNRFGRLVYQSEPHGVSETAKWTTYSDIDPLGRAQTILGPVRDQDGVRPQTIIVYADKQIRTTNAKNQTRIEEKNLLGQISLVQDPIGGLTKFSYDARGNMKTMSDPNGNITSIGYDLRDNKISISDPDKGNWTYRYNKFGELICQQDAKQQAIVYSYDIRGRMVTRSDRSAPANCTDAGISNTSNNINVTYWDYDKENNGLGQLAKVTSMLFNEPEYSQRYNYDKYGRRSETETSFNGHLNILSTHHEKTTYDQYSRVFQEFDAARSTASFENNGVQYSYSATGYLKSIKDAISYAGQQKRFYDIHAMDPRGNATVSVFGNNTYQLTDYYSDSGLVKSLKTYSPNSVSLQYSDLKWDQLGNLESRSEIGGGTWIERYLRSRNISENFQYDDLNRLRYWNTSGDFSANESVSYDAIDNIRNKSGAGDYLYGNQCSSAANAGPHAVCRAGTINYIYDKNGNLLSDGSGRSLQYNVFDLPSYIANGGQNVRFNYGPDRMRYKRVDQNSSSITTTISVGNVEKIYYADGAVEWKRNIAGKVILTQSFNNQGVEQTNKIHYLHHDHLGSLSLITDSNGYVAKDFYFDPWGASRTPNNAITQWVSEQPFLKANKPISSSGFTGHEQLNEVGFIHMNGRIYDAKLGRFVQADPIIQDPLRVQSLNRYSYVWNNPLNATDPSGFQSIRLTGSVAPEDDNGYEQEGSRFDWLSNLGMTPDQDLDLSPDGKSLFDSDSQMEILSGIKALNSAFYNASTNQGGAVGTDGAASITIEDENGYSVVWWSHFNPHQAQSHVSIMNNCNSVCQRQIENIQQDSAWQSATALSIIPTAGLSLEVRAALGVAKQTVNNTTQPVMSLEQKLLEIKRLQQVRRELQAQLDNGRAQAVREISVGRTPNPHGLGREINELIPKEIKAVESELARLNKL